MSETVAIPEDNDSNLLPRRSVVYCGACGMPPEYCPYGPDFETHCDPWLARHHPELRALLAERRGTIVTAPASVKPTTDVPTPARPAHPWTTADRLTAFYEQYVPDKVDSVPALLEKYAGKEDKLFLALTKKYGPEPSDPYYSDSADDDDDDEESNDDDADDDDNRVPADGADVTSDSNQKNKKRRGAAAKKVSEGTVATRVVVQKISQRKRRHLTVIQGMETVPGIKLKDASKMFSKRFAGSSSVKETAVGTKEIIIQGDHQVDVAEMIVDKFGVAESCVFLDMDGDVVPLR
jgi:density-regulated protein DRP1